MSKIVELRYSEKNFLSKYDLYVELFHRFDLKVNDLIPTRSVYLLFTDKGKKILKRIEYSIDELEFIHKALSFIKSTFDRVVDFVPARDGKMYAVWNGEVYCVLDLVEGREFDVNNTEDIAIASRGLAELHRASEGFKAYSRERWSTGKIIDNFERKLEEIRFFKKIANLHEIKSKFDEVFLKNVDYYLQEAEISTSALKTSSYFKLCSEEDKVALCHHDLEHHNITIADNEAYFADFDNAVVDLRINDLSNFMVKTLRNHGYDIDKAWLIIDEYSKVNRLDRRELEVIGNLLRFPEDFYNITRDYYTRRRELEEEVFLDRLNRRTEGAEAREQFLQAFQKSISRQ